MIDFACKTISLQELVRCSFGINKTEYKILVFLMEQEASLTAQEIAKQIRLDRTTVQKSVKNLHEKEIIDKHQVNYTKGGYSFLYSVKSKEHIKEKVMQIVDEWTHNVREHVHKW